MMEKLSIGSSSDRIYGYSFMTNVLKDDANTATVFGSTYVVVVVVVAVSFITSLRE